MTFNCSTSCLMCSHRLPLTPPGVKSTANSGMTLHSLVLISDSFSCNCNSIQSPVSIVHLRVNLILSYPLLRLYINYSISNANHFQLAQQCIQISTRINSSSVHTYIFVCFTLRVILQGFVTQNATWCQKWDEPCSCSISCGRINSVCRITWSCWIACRNTVVLVGMWKHHCIMYSKID